jgi:hypothetical protein
MENGTEMEKSPSNYNPLMLLIIGGVIVFMVFGVIIMAVIPKYYLQPPPIDEPPVVPIGDNCENNGEYCRDCETSCICILGYEGEVCEDKKNATYNPVTYFDDISGTIVLIGTTNSTECEDLCTKDGDNCTAYGYRPSGWVPPFPIRRTFVEEGLCTQVHNFQTGEGVQLDKPLFSTTFEEIQDELIILRRGGEGIQDYPIDYLVVKTGQDCYGYLCHYHEKYGIVWVDDKTYEDSKNFVFTEIVHGGIGPIWYDDLVEIFGNYSGIGKNLGGVLEVTDYPYLHVKRMVDYRNFSFDTLTIAARHGDFYDQQPWVDYDNFDKTLILSDLSVDYVVETEKYDTIILTMAMYNKKSLPRLITNVYDLLKPGGIIVMNDRYWTYINQTGIRNHCMAAGMPTKNFTMEFLDLFEEILFLHSEPFVEPEEIGPPRRGGSGEKGPIWERLNGGEKERRNGGENERRCGDPDHPFNYMDDGCWYIGLGETYYYYPNHEFEWFVFIGRKPM